MACSWPISTGSRLRLSTNRPLPSTCAPQARDVRWSASHCSCPNTVCANKKKQKKSSPPPSSSPPPHHHHHHQDGWVNNDMNKKPCLHHASAQMADKPPQTIATKAGKQSQLDTLSFPRPPPFFHPTHHVLQPQLLPPCLLVLR